MAKKRYNKRSIAEVKETVNPLFLGMTAGTMALIGGATNLASTGIGIGGMLSYQKRMDKAKEDREYRREQEEIASRTSSGGQRFSQEGGTLLTNGLAAGGFSNNEGGLSGELQTVESGGTHEQNPMGGVPVGRGANGKMNTVEEGETSVSINGERFYFSNRTPFPKGIELLPNFIKGNTFAEASESIEKEFKERHDKYSSDTKKDLYQRLAKLQIVITQKINENNPEYAMDGNPNQNQLATGGYKTAYEAYTRAINPDWSTAKARGFTDGTPEANEKLLEHINSGAGQKELNEIYSKINKDLSPTAETVFGMKPLVDLPDDYTPGKEARALDPVLQGMSPLKPEVKTEENLIPDLAGQQFNELGIPVPHTVKPTINKAITKPEEIVQEITPEVAPKVTPKAASEVNQRVNSVVQEREPLIENRLTPKTVAETPTSPIALTGYRTIPPEVKNKRSLFGENAHADVQAGTLAGLGFLTQGVGVASNIIASNRLSDPEKVEAYTIGNKEYEPFLVNRQDILREINRNTTTATKAMQEVSGGDFGTFAANASAITNSGNKAVSSAMLNADIADAQELARVQQMEAGDEKFDSQVKTAADVATAQNKAAYDSQKAAYDMGIAANIGNLGQSLMNYGIASESGEYMGYTAALQALSQRNNRRYTPNYGYGY